jgi:uncharacterized protein YbjT (DUF2867 family)
MQSALAARAGAPLARPGIAAPAQQQQHQRAASLCSALPSASRPASSAASPPLRGGIAADRRRTRARANGDNDDPAAASSAAADELKSRFFSDKEAVPRPASGGAGGDGAAADGAAAANNKAAAGAGKGAAGKRRGGVKGVKVVAAVKRATPAGQPGQQQPGGQQQPPGQPGAGADPAADPSSSTGLLDSANPYVLGRQARQAFDGLWSQLTALASPTRAANNPSFFLVDDFALANSGGAGSVTSSLEEEDDPRAANTTILVVGATGRVGRVLVRKLLLRGYNVRALVRRRAGIRDDTEGAVPAAVELVEGDVGDERVASAAVRGVDKIVYCAGARTSVTADLTRVEESGVKLLARALQDEALRRAKSAPSEGEEGEGEAGGGSRPRRRGRTANSRLSKRVLADFGERYHQLRWDVRFVGLPPSVLAEEEAARVAAASAPGGSWNAAAAAARSPYARAGSNVARASIGEAGDTMVFEGTLGARGAVAEVGAELNPTLPRGEHRTAGAEGLTARVRGDGRIYALVLQTKGGARYAARFPTRQGNWVTVRLPFEKFRGEEEGMPPLTPDDIAAVSIRYEAPRRAGNGGFGAAGGGQQAEEQQQQLVGAGAAAAAGRESPTAAAAAARPSLLQARLAAEEQAAQRAADLAARQRQLAASNAAANSNPSAQKFRVEVDWIKALPGGLEPDFVLVSCAGAPRPGVDPSDIARAVAAKRRGEERLRASGLGYTVVRPGPLVDEPGGYRALVFDQAERPDSRQPVSAADVADVCLRALHEPAARNKTFDLSYEYKPEDGASLYELVASVPKKGGDYLAPALSVLQKNT